MIKSYAYNEGEILRSIFGLHLQGGVIHLDPTYSKGSIYKTAGLPEPIIKCDLFPVDAETMETDSRFLPFSRGTIDSILFDPPFLIDSENSKKSGKMVRRFHAYNTYAQLWQMYFDSLVEFERVLKKKGVLIFKCQDTVSGRAQYFSHAYVLNAANKAGFYAKDLFILLSKNRMRGAWKTSVHARKFHCYYWVFTKQKINVNHLLHL
jgi:hypothetical protein